jgi:hypothetical protein
MKSGEGFHAALAKITYHARDNARNEFCHWPPMALAIQYRHSELSERGRWRHYGGADVGVLKKGCDTLSDISYWGQNCDPMISILE